MKTGVWYVLGFTIAFVYFYVYAVNYIRGVRAEDTYEPIRSVQDFHERIRRQVKTLKRRPSGGGDPLRQLPLPVARQQANRRSDGLQNRQLQQPIHPRSIHLSFHKAIYNKTLNLSTYSQ